jgi:hypothetical protein
MAAVVALLVAPTASSKSPTPPDAGCDDGRLAVAFHSDGSIVNASQVPNPCAVTTGFQGAESLIKVAPDGTILEEPAIIHAGPLGSVNVTPPRPRFDSFESYAGLAVSGNNGKSWDLAIPDGTAGFGTLDNGLYIDRETGRAFLSSNEVIQKAGDLTLSPLATSGSRLETSMPPYTKWTGSVMPTISENPRFTSAPAPAGYPAARQGENVAYWCGNVFIFGSGGRVCFRSLDGGASWQFASQLVGGPPHSECGADPGSVVPSSSGEYPEGDNSDGPHRGSLWVFLACDAGNRFGLPGAKYLARSDDEAATWPIIHKPDGTPATVQGDELRVDTAGNLYAFEKAGSQLLMRISRDGGLNWGDPLNMTAPAARDKTVGQWAVAVGKPGEVAFSYFASRAADSGNDGYISVTHDALAANPTFYAAAVNSPERLLQSAKGVGTDYIGVDIGPDGTPWASFYSDCFKNGNGQFEDASCAQTAGQTGNGVPPTPSPGSATTVGHLSFPS